MIRRGGTPRARDALTKSRSLSVIASSVNELIASNLKWRAKDLERALLALLGPALFKLVAGDPTITLRSDYDTPAAVLADLRRGALDAAIVDNASALSDLGHQPGLIALDPALTLDPYVLAVPAEAYQLHDSINHALGDLRDEGFFEQLGKKWFVDAPLKAP